MDAITRFVMQAQSDRFHDHRTVRAIWDQPQNRLQTIWSATPRAGLRAWRSAATGRHVFRRSPDEAVEALIVEERRLHRTWGPKKLHKVLEVKHGIESPPAR